MNASNPFQVPAWAQINSEQRRRERFKKTVIAIVAAFVVLLVGLLIEGCKTARDTMSTAVTPPTPDMSQDQASAAQPVPPQTNPISKESVSKASPVADVGHPVAVYEIKPGDTLSRIAKAHGTSVKAIEAANALDSDRILVGAKLKIPAA